MRTRLTRYLPAIKRIMGVESPRKRVPTPAPKPPPAPPAVPLSHVVIGLGSQKSGTTWLAKVLADHTDIHVRTKEVHYWDTVRPPYVRWDRVSRIIAARGNRAKSPFGANPLDHSRYLPSLEYARSTQAIVAEITPSYALCSPATFAQMQAVHDDVRFIFLMRDPVDRLWSGLRHKMRVTLRKGNSGAFMEQMFLDACADPFDPDFRRSRYDQTLRALDQAGGKVCTMFYETLFTDDSLATLADFIGVDALPAELGKRVHVGAGADLRLSDATRAAGRAALAETYDFITDRFGDRVPAKWHV